MKNSLDWESQETHWMLNPLWTSQENKFVEKAKISAPKLKSTIWIRSSGTTGRGEVRWVALSKNAFLVSAQAVNKHLQVTPGDVWLRCLPEFHVGGLSIHARAFLGQNEIVVSASWDILSFIDLIEKNF